MPALSLPTFGFGYRECKMDYKLRVLDKLNVTRVALEN